MRILVLGASGMIGSAMMRILSDNADFEVFGSIRCSDQKRFFSLEISSRLIAGVDAMELDDLIKTLESVRPSVVINCIGITKHKVDIEEPLVSIPINTLMPHRLASLCKLIGSRFIHISSDCVFSGIKGNYLEGDFTDAYDIYGKSKALGEVDYGNNITLRTSTIGHELNSIYGLLDWFLVQKNECKGYTKAIFSGLPTVEFAKVVRDFIIPNTKISGLYHVSSLPISKYDLLRLIAVEYNKNINILQDDQLVIDRSLDSTLFQKTTGYIAKEWTELVHLMR